MLFKTHILRGAARELRDLIDKSVYADLASSEQNRAHATDPKRGSEREPTLRG
jgi:hypothetical protein